MSRTTRRPDRASARIRRGGRGDSLCDGAAETRRRAARRAVTRRTRFREENHGKNASATAAGGSGRLILASVKKVSGRFRDARKYFSPSVYRGLVKIWDNLSQKIWDKPAETRLLDWIGLSLSIWREHRLGLGSHRHDLVQRWERNALFIRDVFDEDLVVNIISRVQPPTRTSS